MRKARAIPVVAIIASTTVSANERQVEVPKPAVLSGACAKAVSLAIDHFFAPERREVLSRYGPDFLDISQYEITAWELPKDCFVRVKKKDKKGRVADDEGVLYYLVRKGDHHMPEPSEVCPLPFTFCRGAPDEVQLWPKTPGPPCSTGFDCDGRKDSTTR